MQNTISMDKLIDDLLSFCRLGRNEIKAKEINMTDLVKSVRNELLQKDSANRNHFTVSALPAKREDRALMIRQVWVNLVYNAIKYSKDKPLTKVEIGAYEKDNSIVYYVKDNGLGV